MKEGWLSRSFTATLKNDVEISVKASVFLVLLKKKLVQLNIKSAL